MRAVAISLVVAYHARLPGFQAGFIGVDVFFVLSGFLITRQILAEIAESGGIDVINFWARRVRRLLPASTVVLIATGIASMLWMTRLNWQALGLDVGASALYASNVLFAVRADSYFNGDAAGSPVLHTWSLAVEEQFYLAWPLLLAAAAWAARRDERRRARFVTWSLVAVMGASFVGCMLMNGSPWAFFMSPTRAWEFGLGACVAAVQPGARSRALGAVSVAVGLILLAVGSVLIDGEGVYPGLATLWPVLGTAAIIVGGGIAADSAPARLLALAPLQWIGRLSYSWYLWHWPLLFFCADLPGDRALLSALGGTGSRVAAVVIALLLAAATHSLVENPVRFHPRLAKSKRRTFILAGALTLASLAVSGTMLVMDALTPGDAWLKTLADAKADAVPIKACETSDVEVLKQKCSFGDPAKPIRVVLIGDSHAGHWSPALDVIGRQQGWRGIYFGLGNCPVVHVDVRQARDKNRDRCGAWRSELIPLLKRLSPELVVASNASSYPKLGWIVGEGGRRLTFEEQVAAWQVGVESAVTQLRSAGMRVLWILDTPRLREGDNMECLERTRDPDECAVPREAVLAFTAGARGAELAAFERLGRDLAVDPVPWLCDETSCPMIKSGTIVYRDINHLTASFARVLAPRLEPHLGLR